MAGSIENLTIWYGITRSHLHWHWHFYPAVTACFHLLCAKPNWPADLLLRTILRMGGYEVIVFMRFPLIRHDRSHPDVRLSPRTDWDRLQWSRWSIYHNGCVHSGEGYQRKARSCAIMVAWYANFTWHLSTITNVVEGGGLLQVWKLPTIFDSVRFDECVMNREHVKVRYWRSLFSTKTDF